MSDKMRRWNHVTEERLEVDRGGRQNKRTHDRVCVCVSADVQKSVQMFVCTSWRQHYKADTFVSVLITIKTHTRKSRAA